MRKYNWVYILQVKNGNYYTGYTTDLKKRLEEHRAGKGAKFTKAFKVKKLLGAWKVYGPKSNAMKVEAFIKRQSREVKEEFIKKPRLLRYKCNKYCSNTLR